MPSFYVNTSLEILSPNMSYWELRLQYMHFRGTQSNPSHSLQLPRLFCFCFYHGLDWTPAFLNNPCLISLFMVQSCPGEKWIRGANRDNKGVLSEALEPAVQSS